MRVVWKDGKVYEGPTSLDVVRDMLRAHPFTRDMGEGVYMKAVALRAEVFRNATVRTGDAVQFLLDLETAGYVRIDA